MIDKIKKVFKGKPETTTELLKHNERFRKKYIPDRYNQIELVDYLYDDTLDHYISISNRSDGKSFNYINYFIDYSITTDIGFMLIARHYTVRFSYQKLLEEIIEILKDKYDIKRFHFIRTDFYILVGYDDKEIGIITDLNQATDLKYLSNYLKHFPILIYDEFLALESDYLPDEWERLKTIYSSVNRKEDIPYIKYPKLFYLGNAVNFSSPVLANLNIFNHLENHKINTCQIYDNVVLEMRRNDNINDTRNLRAFKEEDDNMTMGEFEINNHNIADDDFRKKLKTNVIKVVVKTSNNYLVIEYNRDTLDILLSISVYEEDYHFNTELKDNKDDSIFLDSIFYDDEHYRKFDKGYFKFENQYSKDVILSNYIGLSDLDILKVISYYELENIENEDIREKQYKDNYIRDTKESLFKKFYGLM